MPEIRTLHTRISQIFFALRSSTALRLFAMAIVCAGISCADTMTSLHIRLGTWDGTTFSPDGSDWNTFSGANWAISATAPGLGNPVLDGFNSVSLPDANYWLYMAANGDNSSNAIEITVGYAGGPNTEIFTDPTGPEFGGSYTLVSGSGFSANLISAPQSAYAPAGEFQSHYADGDGSPDWIVDLNTGGLTAPEPGSWGLMLAGAAAFGLVLRKRLA